MKGRQSLEAAAYAIRVPATGLPPASRPTDEDGAGAQNTAAPAPVQNPEELRCVSRRSCPVKAGVRIGLLTAVCSFQSIKSGPDSVKSMPIDCSGVTVFLQHQHGERDCGNGTQTGHDVGAG